MIFERIGALRSWANSCSSRVALLTGSAALRGRASRGRRNRAAGLSVAGHSVGADKLTTLPGSAASPAYERLASTAGTRRQGRKPLIPTGVLMAPNDRAASSKGGDREKSLDAALAQIERQFGRGAIMRLGDETRAPIEVIPTGSRSEEHT